MMLYFILFFFFLFFPYVFFLRHSAYLAVGKVFFFFSFISRSVWVSLLFLIFFVLIFLPTCCDDSFFPPSSIASLTFVLLLPFLS